MEDFRRESASDPLPNLRPSAQSADDPKVPTASVHDDFLKLRDLAADLFNLVARLGDGFGWTPAQTIAFQAPVARIRDAAQEAFDKNQERSSAGSPSLSALTDRELHVFRLIGRGGGTGDIARELGLSVKTIEYYRAQIKSKLGYHDKDALRKGAFQWAQRGS